jgi:hypothetical protein
VALTNDPDPYRIGIVFSPMKPDATPVARTISLAKVHEGRPLTDFGPSGLMALPTAIYVSCWAPKTDSFCNLLLDYNVDPSGADSSVIVQVPAAGSV